MYPIKPSGFTLIEILLVMTILGILAAVAIPAYQNYLKRAHVLEGINIAGAPKFAVYEYYYWNGSLPTNNLSADLPEPSAIKGNAVKSISIENGIIKITYNQRVKENDYLLITPTIADGSLVWDCKGGTVEAYLRPMHCR